MEKKPQGQLVQAETRPDYVIVYYIEPVKGNEAALGFDIASNEKRLKSIEVARDSDAVVVTERISLVQGNENEAGVLILSPVYRHGASQQTISERRVALEGFAVGVLRIGQVLRQNLFADTAGMMYLHLYDNPEGQTEQLLYCISNEDVESDVEFGQDRKRVEADYHWQTDIAVGGRHWTIILTPSAAYRESRRSVLAWLVLGVSLLFCLVLFRYLWKSLGYTQKLEQHRGDLEKLVQQRTADVHAVNRELEEEINERKQAGLLMEKNEARIRALVDNLKLASGIAPLQAMLERGIRVGIGTDGAASNNSLDLFREMDICAKMHKLPALDPVAVPAEYIMHMATNSGASVLGWQEEIGSLEEGKKADIILINQDVPHLQPMHGMDVLVYAGQGAGVQTVLVNGNVVMQDRKILSFDLEETLEQVRLLADQIKKVP
ncbi:MAG: hypothetical protein D3910_17335 [Candidatus Electrothrix sp. ATG2]|nr:hypothetical protein [Candidatus Electrothrix sp. ATG2]